jgi:hypothetical protein
MNLITIIPTNKRNTKDINKINKLTNLIFFSLNILKYSMKFYFKNVVEIYVFL